jgi:hypothetical protein
MVSAKLVHQIEDHWEAISSRFLRLVRGTPGHPTLARIPESEINEHCRRLLRNLGNYMVSGEEEILAAHEKVGRERFRQGFKFSEALRALQLMKEAVLAYIRDQVTFENTVDIYAEEELEHDLGRFFDLLIYHMARGYEEEASLKHHVARS